MPSLLSPLLRLTPQPLTTNTRLLLRRRRHRRITMSTAAAGSTIIEHVVLFNVNPTTDPTLTTRMLASLNSLATLPFVLHLTAGPIRRLHAPPPLHFTHLLHSHYRSVSDLDSYSSHPDHLSVVRSHVLPICDDFMALDWKNENLDRADSGSSGSAMRVQFVKLKEGAGEKEREEVKEVIGGVKGKVEGLSGVSYGVNFSPARAKGFGIGCIGFFDGVRELGEEGVRSEVVEKEKERVRGYIDGVIVADYVLPEKKDPSSSL